MIAPMLVCAILGLTEDRPTSTVDGLDVSDAAIRTSIERGLEALYSAQQENGSFGAIRTLTFNSYFANPATYHCWQIGASALATQAILQVGKDERAREAVDRGLDYLVRNATVFRPAEWDIDNNWSLIYGLTTLTAAIAHPRFAGSDREAALREAATKMIAGLKEYQGARGGWGYYADPDANWRPDWGTSFTTAAALLALLDAEALGLAVDGNMKAAAIRAIERAQLPNGAYDYDIGALPRHLSLESINQVKGSLGRIQICNHALLRAGVELETGAIERGVEQFFEHHKFLAVARHKPIPHEAYYQNAAYFYLFGHYYATFTIDRLPASERKAAYTQLRAKLLECQNDDGSFWDFWIADLAKSYGTAFAIMALDKSLLPEPTAPASP